MRIASAKPSSRVSAGAYSGASEPAARIVTCAAPSASAPSSKSATERSDVLHFERNHVRGQTAPAAPESRHELSAVGRVVEEQARRAAARVAVGLQRRAQTRPQVGDARIRVGHRARRTHGRAPAAAHAQVRIDLTAVVVAVARNRGGRADVEAFRAARDSRAAVRADALVVGVEARLLELADPCGRARRPPGIAPADRGPARNSLAGGWLIFSSGSAQRSSTRSKRSSRPVSARSKSIAFTSPHAATHWRCARQRSRSIW